MLAVKPTKEEWEAQARRLVPSTHSPKLVPMPETTFIVTAQVDKKKKVLIIKDEKYKIFITHWAVHNAEQRKPYLAELFKLQAVNLEVKPQFHTDNTYSFIAQNKIIAIMVGIDCDGFDVRTDNELLRFDFEQPVTDASEARQALVTMAHEARAL